MESNQPKGLLSVQTIEHKELPIGDEMAWFRHRLGRIVAGGIYLIAGQPGIGKSTLMVQLAISLALNGLRTLFILTEQTKADLVNTIKHMTSDLQEDLQQKVLGLIEAVDGIKKLEELPNFVSFHVAPSGEPLHGVSLIVLDSVQGHGLSSAATKQYAHLDVFNDLCKAHGIAAALVSHVTKGGDIMGPKTLEHTVDCVMKIDKFLKGRRPLYVKKNRFGPSESKPFLLAMDKVTRWLRPSLHVERSSSVARTYLGAGTGMAEVQVAVALPALGFRGHITTQVVPQKVVKQLLSLAAQILDTEAEELGYTISCKMPEVEDYDRRAELALAIAELGAFLDKNIPDTYCFIGELDLQGKVRDVPDPVFSDFIKVVRSGRFPLPLRVYCSKATCAKLNEPIEGLTLVCCDFLEDAVYDLWPELKK